MVDKKSDKKNENFLEIKVSRRTFIKGLIAGLIGLGAGAYLINDFLRKVTEGKLSSVFKDSAPEELWKWSKEAYHYIKLGNNVQCQVCPNRCLLEPGDRSVCRVKVNKGGKLYTLAYGNPCAVHVDPIEKKPLFHFLPTTTAFSIATAGCNFRCQNCQNWTISQSRPEETENYDLFPEKVVQGAKDYDCASIAYTYSEPTAFYEYMIETSKLAREAGIKNLWITNGHINGGPLKELCKYLDAANVDLKSFRESIYNELNSGRMEPILDTLKTLKRQNVWFEVTNLVVPTWTDDMSMIEEMCEWLVKNIGPDYPLHFSRFYPMHKLTSLPQTPVKTLEEARKIALDCGLKFVYIGNVPMHEAQNTYCPNCGKVIIDRNGYAVQNDLVDGTCGDCGEKIAGVWA